MFLHQIIHQNSLELNYKIVKMAFHLAQFRRQTTESDLVFAEAP